MREPPVGRGAGNRELHEPHARRWILLALECADGHSLTAVKLQKTLFLLGARRKREVGSDFYHFRPYHYGPFSVEIYHDADALSGRGFLRLDTFYGQAMRRYVLTPLGEKTAKQLAKAVSPKALAYLSEVVAWAQPLPFNALVRQVYEQFPKMRRNSIFWDPSDK